MPMNVSLSLCSRQEKSSSFRPTAIESHLAQLRTGPKSRPLVQYCADSWVAGGLGFPWPGDTDGCGADQHTRLPAWLNGGLDSLPDCVRGVPRTPACD